MSIAAPRPATDDVRAGERPDAAVAPYGWLPLAALAALMLITAVILMSAGRGSTFSFDEWNYVLDRQGWHPGDFLRPHNEHLTLVPVLLYKLLFETVGLDSYGVFRAMLVAADLLCGLLLFLYARPRVGPWAAVAVTAPLMLMGPAFWDVIWPFQIGFLLSLAAGLGALLALDRGDRAGDVIACVLLGVSLASSGIGVPIAAGVLVDVVLRPAWRARLWVPLVPIALYAFWYLGYGRSAAKAKNIPDVPHWILDAASASAGAITGAGAAWGVVLAAGLAALAARRLLRPGAIDPRVAALIVMPLALWAATALARADMGNQPGEARYLYPGGMLLAVLAVELARGHLVRGRAALLLAAALGLGALANVDALRDSSPQLRAQGAATKGVVSAIELIGARADPGAAPDAGQPQLRVGPYLAARGRYGSSPAYAPKDLASAPLGVRGPADSVLITLGGNGLALVQGRAPSTGGPAPQHTETAGTSKVEGSCVRYTPTGAGAEVTAVVPPSGLVLRAGSAPVEIRLRRFGDAYPTNAQGTLQPGQAATVKLPRDAAPQPWRVGMRSAAPVRACTTGVG